MRYASSCNVCLVQAEATAGLSADVHVVSRRNRLPVIAGISATVQLFRCSGGVPPLHWLAAFRGHLGMPQYFHWHFDAGTRCLCGCMLRGASRLSVRDKLVAALTDAQQMWPRPLLSASCHRGLWAAVPSASWPKWLSLLLAVPCYSSKCVERVCWAQDPCNSFPADKTRWRSKDGV